MNVSFDFVIARIQDAVRQFAPDTRVACSKYADLTPDDTQIEIYHARPVEGVKGNEVGYLHAIDFGELRLLTEGEALDVVRTQVIVALAALDEKTLEALRQRAPTPEAKTP